MRLLLLTLMSLVAACAESDVAVDQIQGTRSAGVILQYHHVDASTPRVTSTTPQEFESHMTYLHEQGFTVWPLERLVAAARNNEATPDRVVAITFDDAYDSIYTTAFPILASYNWPFTIFVATEPVEQAQARYLSWEQLAEMKEAGATIANHTHTHTHMLRRQPQEDHDAWLARIKGDIEQSQSLIIEHLGDAPMLFAYPYGEYNMELASLIESLGYVGFGQQSGAIGPDLDFRLLPRFPFGGSYNDLDSFKSKVNTLPLPTDVSLVEPMVEENLQPELTIRFSEPHPRLHQLVCYGPGGPTNLERVSETEIIARAIQDVPVGRSRYNCTMPADGADGRFHWYSQLWIRKRPDGSWYPEP